MVRLTKIALHRAWAESVYVTGEFNGHVDFDPDATKEDRDQSKTKDSDVLLSRFSADAKDGRFLWHQCWGGTGVDVGEDLAIDKSGNIFLVGSFSNSVDFDPRLFHKDNRSSHGQADCFLMKVVPK